MAVTAKSEADGDSAAGDLPYIDHRHSLRTGATITAAFGRDQAVQFLLSFLLLSDVPGAGSSTASIVNISNGCCSTGAASARQAARTAHSLSCPIWP
jgi:hypothetical protein